MKTIAIGDTHGRDAWKRITAKKDFDKVIFIGDYFDTRDGIPPQRQMENFGEIVAFKRANIGKVILLIGNHDFHYMKGIRDRYSQFQIHWHADIQNLLHSALDDNLMQICHIQGNLLFVHAGVTRTWCRANNIDAMNVEKSINDLFGYNPNAFRFTSGEYGSNNGDDITQSPIWVRPRSLYMDKIANYIQVVGHTTHDTITGLNGSMKLYTRGMMIETSGVIFIDTLGGSGEYLQIVDGVMSAKK